MQIISGKELSAKLKAEMAKDVATYKGKYGRLPKLSVILVGEDPGSVSYVTRSVYSTRRYVSKRECPKRRCCSK